MGRPEHILVAEDDLSDAFFLKRAFKRSEILSTMHFVRDGQEAINYLSGQGNFSLRSTYPLPDLLLLDVRMPRLDGFDVLRWIRKRTSLNSVFVVIFTSSEEAHDIDRALKLGANSYLVKPHSIQELSDLVASLKKHWIPPGKAGRVDCRGKVGFPLRSGRLRPLQGERRGRLWEHRMGRRQL